MVGEVLVDTSVWIDFLRSARAKEQIEVLLNERWALVCGLVVAELYRGARGKKERSILSELLAVVRSVGIGPDTYRRAGELGARMAAQGMTVATVDLVIAQTGIDLKLPVLTYDKHFREIAKHGSLELVAESG